MGTEAELTVQTWKERGSPQPVATSLSTPLGTPPVGANTHSLCTPEPGTVRARASAAGGVGEWTEGWPALTSAEGEGGADGRLNWPPKKSLFAVGPYRVDLASAAAPRVPVPPQVGHSPPITCPPAGERNWETRAYEAAPLTPSPKGQT